MKRRYESPVKRINPSGRTVWVARYTDETGRRRSAGTYALRRDAQQAINTAYDRPRETGTVGDYFQTWLEHHPRSERTNESHHRRVHAVLNVKVEGIRLRDWPYMQLRRRHALILVDHLLRVQGRATTGATGVIRTLAAMTEDAITDEVTDVNAFRKVTIRANDPRAQKTRRTRPILTFEEMHTFARAAGRYEPMVRTLADTGLRLGELLALQRSDYDGEAFRVQRTAWRGELEDGTKTDHGETNPGRVVPCPPGLREVLRAMPTRIDSPMLFPTPRGHVWQDRNFYRDVWRPAQRASGMDVLPHDFRHSYVSHLRAAGVIDDADLAAIAGHTVGTMLTTYTHALHQSFDRVREVIG